MEMGQVKVPGMRASAVGCGGNSQGGVEVILNKTYISPIPPLRGGKELGVQLAGRR